MNNEQWFTSLLIAVPMLPPKECSPNWRGHWAQRYKASEEYKKAVGWSAKSVLCQLPEDFKVIDFAEIEVTFIVAEERVRDADNWHARLKPGIDELIEVGVIHYDDIKHLKVKDMKFIVDPDRAPATIIEVRSQSRGGVA